MVTSAVRVSLVLLYLATYSDCQARILYDVGDQEGLDTPHTGEHPGSEDITDTATTEYIPDIADTPDSTEIPDTPHSTQSSDPPNTPHTPNSLIYLLTGIAVVITITCVLVATCLAMKWVLFNLDDRSELGKFF